MIRQTYGNLLDVQRGIILHGCNAQCVMESGVAKQLRAKYPPIFDVYKTALQRATQGSAHSGLGTLSAYKPHDDLIIVNLITQLNYGKAGKKYVSYDAIDEALQNFVAAFEDTELPVYLPTIGAGLGGGDWGVILALITKHLSCFDTTILLRN